MAIPDSVEIVMGILLAESGIVALVTHPTTRGGSPVTEISIYGDKLPQRPLMDAGIVNTPATALVVKGLPGPRDTDGGLSRPRILMRAYANSIANANELSSLVDEILHDETFDITIGSNTFRIELEMISGPNADLEMGTGFPFCDRLYNTAVM